MKDRPQLWEIGKLIYIPGIYYESMDGFLQNFCRIVMDHCDSEGLTYTYHELTGRVTFKWVKRSLTWRSFEKSFFDLFGLETDWV